jgi:hypothetical protein
MTLRKALLAATLGCLMGLLSCNRGQTDTTPITTAPTKANTPAALTAAGPLPAAGFKAEISLPDPPAKLRTGQVEVINIKVKNTSDVTWWQRGGQTTDRTDNKFYIAAGNHWLDKDGKMTSETEGHNGIPKDLKPGEETEMTLQITAPKQPGEWILDLDMVQEGVSWFREKGSPTTKIKVTVVK